MIRPRDRLRRVPMALLATLALLMLSTSVRAHTIGLSRGEYHVTEQGVDVALVLARGEVLAAVPSLDPDGDGAVDEATLAASRAALHRDMIAKIRVTAPDASCAGSLVDAVLAEGDGVELRGRYVCP